MAITHLLGLIKILKIVAMSNAGKDVKKLDFSNIAGGNVKWYSHPGK